ncbi:MAG: AAA family ATPase, partial [Polyangiales bacterium]
MAAPTLTTRTHASTLATWPAVPGASNLSAALGCYAIEDVLGHGGMGVVYKARDTRDDSIVALKTMTSTEPTAIYRLKREFRALADITHPNLVRLYELACVDETWFFTMEWIDGTPFLPRLSGDESRLRAAFVELVLGIGAIHDAGKLHCDIKSSNVLVDHTGRVVVLDFGIVKARDPNDPLYTFDGDIRGTPSYMSPEQAANRHIGPASDWYSVGVMLYEALCGALPHDGSALAVMAAKQHTTPARPSSRSAGIPASLDALCMELLAIAPEHRPGRDEILRRLAPRDTTRPSRRPPPLDSQPPPERVIGREHELGQLRAAASDSRAGQPVLVLLTGSSGIGKTSLMQQLARELAEQPDTLILRATCYERESLPYKAFDPVIDELSRYLDRLGEREASALLPRDTPALARMFPVLQRVHAVAAVRSRKRQDGDPIGLRRAAARALRELLARIADAHTLVMMIDDLQWGDAESAHLLAELFGPPDPPAVLVIGSARSARSEDIEASPLLHELFRGGACTFGEHVRRIELRELSPEAALSLAKSLLPAASSDALAHAIVRDAGGYPLFLHELSCHNEGPQPTASDAPANGPRTSRLDALLEQRIEALAPAPRALLELAAVSGRPVSPLLLQRIERSADAATWRQLCHERLLRAVGHDGTPLTECYHDRVRQAVLGLIPDERLTTHHRALALALEREGGAEPEALVEHYRAAGDLEHARRYVLVSADTAADALAFSRAARLYRLALEMGTPTLAQRASLLQRLAAALASAGCGTAAADVYEQAAAYTTGLARVELRRLAAQHFLSSGREERGLVLLQQVCRELHLRYPATEHAALASILWERAKLRVLGLRYRERKASPRELARVDACFSAAVGLSLSDLARSAAFSARHLRLALRAGEPGRIARGLTFELSIAAGAGQEGLRWAERALPLAERLRDRQRDPYHAGLCFLARAHVAYMQGRWRLTVEWIERAEELLREAQGVDVQWALLSGNVLAAVSMVVIGDLTRARERIPRFLREAEERGDRHGIALMSYARVLLALADDAIPSAEAVLDAARETWPTTPAFRLRDFQMLHCQLLIERYAGHNQRAHLALSRRWGDIERSKLLLVNILRVTAIAERGSAALDCAAFGGGRRYQRQGRAAAAQLERERLPHAQALASLLHARLDSRRGASLDWLQRAGQQFDACGMPLHAESARRCAGLVMNDELGAILVRQADVRLLRLGVRHPARFAA